MNNEGGGVGHLDLSSFPLLMIHEVPRHSSATLSKSAAELVLMSADETSPLHSFLVKLLKVIRSELEKRSAEARISAMLSDSKSPCPFKPSADITTPGLDEIYKVEHAKSLLEAAPRDRERNSSFRVPLPSELKRSHSAQGDRVLKDPYISF